MARRKLFRTGNSVAVSLPDEVLDGLKLEAGAEVWLELDHERRQLILRPLPSELGGVDEEFARQVAEFIEEYRPALEALASD